MMETLMLPLFIGKGGKPVYGFSIKAGSNAEQDETFEARVRALLGCRGDVLLIPDAYVPLVVRDVATTELIAEFEEAFGDDD